jgi:protein-L-isoaspartate(D-aspartate) O-methyltransferase
MVESQVRPSDVTDRRIIRAMSEVAREVFVPANMRAVAYMDDALPVAFAGTRPTRLLLAPRTLAKLIQLMQIEADAAVLDVAPATGYSSAVLARMARRVIACEPDAALAAAAKSALETVGATNVVVHHGPAPDGRTHDGPFDAILIGGAVDQVPRGLLDQLKAGGRLVTVLNRKGVVVTRAGGTYPVREAFDAAAAFVPGLEPKPAFTF